MALAASYCRDVIHTLPIRRGAVSRFLLSHPPLASAQTSAPLPTQQLDDLVAPIALYPDSLIAQVLAASTYPIEIAEAEQWVKDHPKWKAAKLMDESKKEKWDPSVKALVTFPQVLTMMTESLTWTTQLGTRRRPRMAIVEHYRLGEIVGGPTAATNGNTQSFYSARRLPDYLDGHEGLEARWLAAPRSRQSSRQCLRQERGRASQTEGMKCWSVR
jgi:hypothetical protein